MKKLFLISLLFAEATFALEFSAGMRETFITPNNYHFGSDSSARIRRALKDNGFNRFTLNTRLNLHQDSYISHPRLKSSLRDLRTMISLVRFGGGKVSVKPQIMFGETHIPNLDKAEDSNLNLLFSTYQREISRYLNLSRKSDVDELIIGAGVNVLYKNNFSGLHNFHQYIDAVKSPETKLSLNIDDSSVLGNLDETLVLSINQFFDSVTYSIVSTENLDLKISELYRLHSEYFPDLAFSIADLVITGCTEVVEGKNK